MRRLITNSALNLAAFGASAAINVVLVAVLVRQYGLAAYGVLALVRLMHPANLLGVVDAALPAVGMRRAAVAAGRGRLGDLPPLATALLATALALGVVLAGLVGAATGGAGASGPLLAWFSVGPDLADDARRGLLAAALAIPALYVGQAAQSLLEGLQRFAPGRAAEVLANLAFAGAAIALAGAGAPIGTVAVLYALLQAVRALAITAVALGALARTGPGRAGWRPRVEDFTGLWPDIRVLYLGRVINGLRQFLPQIVVGQVLGPAGLGAYDAAGRLPRLLKTGFGLITSALIPASATLDAGGRRSDLRGLIARSLRLSLLASLPLSFVTIAFAEPILRVWLGSSEPTLALCVSLAMAATLLTVLSTVGLAGIAADLDALARSNRIRMVEFATMAGLAVVLTPWTGIVGAFAAVFAASAVAFLMQQALLEATLALGTPPLGFGRAGLAAALAATAGAALAAPAGTGWLPVLLGSALAWLAASLAVLAALPAEARRDVLRILGHARTVAVRVPRARR